MPASKNTRDTIIIHISNTWLYWAVSTLTFSPLTQNFIHMHDMDTKYNWMQILNMLDLHAKFDSDPTFELEDNYANVTDTQTHRHVHTYQSDYSGSFLDTSYPKRPIM